MNALPSFDPPKHRPPSRKSSRARSKQMGTNTLEPSISTTHSTTTTARSTRTRSKPTYAHRRQGLEVATKLVTYSTLSVFGIITLVNSVGYHYVQRSKLQDAKIRADKVNTNFTRSFDPQSQASVMQENSYKVAPDRLPIFLVNPETDRSSSTERK
jgi:hypothetical protein